MHYIIDGYNILFRRQEAHHQDLQSQREKLLSEFQGYIDILNLSITLVFDATDREELSRQHYRSLEIVFTDQNQNADDYIVNILKASSHPQRNTVVTSDNMLAWHCRRCGARTISVEKFLSKLKRCYHKKLHKRSISRRTLEKKTSPKKISSFLKDQERYEKQFKERYKDLLKQEEKLKDHPEISKDRGS